MSHTLGPWQIKSEYEPEYVIGDIDGPDDGTMYYQPVCMVMETKRFEANARLIASAPDLLDALQVLVRCYEHDGIPNDTEGYVENARAAIALATGTSINSSAKDVG